MSAPRLLLPVLALLSARCTGGEPDGSASSTAPATTSSATTQTSFPQTTDAGTTQLPTTTVEPTTSTASTSTSGDASSSTTDALTTGSTSTSSSTTDAGTTDASTSTSSSSSSTSGSSTTGNNDPVCGDGVVEGDEQCDDGNDIDADACLGDCTPGQAVLVLAGTGEAPGVLARFVPGPGWTVSQAGTSIVEPALAPTPTGALAVVRRDGPKMQDKNELAWCAWSPGQPDQLVNFADVGVFGYGIDGPGLASVADTATLAFLGTDNKHYTSLFTNGAWSPFGPLPAGMVQLQAFGPSAATLASGTVETYAVYAGDDARIYYSSKSSPGGAWQASSLASPPAVVNTLTPAALVDDQGDLVLAYVRKADGKIAVAKLITPQNAWTTETIVSAQAITASEIALLRTDAGAYYLAWKGFGNQGIYAVRGTADDKWGTPFTIQEPMTASQPPALARGALGADAELVYVTGGKLRHARLVGDKVDSLADVPGPSDLATRPAALRVQLKP